VIAYLDTSAVLRYLLNDPEQFTRFGKWEKQGSSELLEVECQRTFERMRLQGELTDHEVVDLKDDLKNFLENMDLIDLGPEILARAKGSYPVVLRTLDALHLSTAEVWSKYLQKPVTVVTHDKRMSLAAKSIGLSVFTE
jgi:predicted nucleic acid-binding protein